MTGNRVTFNLPTMAIGTFFNFTIDLNTLDTLMLGTELLQHLLGDTPNGPNSGDNVVHFTDSVVGSYDPNDKSVTPSVLTPWSVHLGETDLEYTIRFQNTGTYLAERVVIVDTLSANLQWNTFEFKGSSHTCQWYMTNGVLHFIHDNIFLPDSTSDEPNSHGFVRFTIKPDLYLTEGTTIENIANIYFDFNEPIITPPAVFSVDVLASVAEEAGNAFRIYPNPVHDRLWITLPETHEPVINYTITDLLGKVQASGASTSGGVNVRELASGLYTLKVDHLGEPKSVRFVKE
ncbi:MAG: T9SS type A sorting domain-containing protein [Flavobacteriales bacterium]|nr:T9SS type A sorting domain-containing protein [Flavobacteriales bacterium]